MTHDVEDRAGYEFCDELMDIDDEHDIKASLQIVPEGHYRCSDAMLDQIRERGFELNVQDLNHDGYLFADRSEFLRRAKKINEYGRAFGAKGFRAAVLYRNLEWMDALEFSYDMSVPNVAHLDPQHGGCCSVMPYFVGRHSGNPADHHAGLHVVPHARRLFARPVEDSGGGDSRKARSYQLPGSSRLHH